MSPNALPQVRCADRTPDKSDTIAHASEELAWSDDAPDARIVRTAKRSAQAARDPSNTASDEDDVHEHRRAGDLPDSRELVDAIAELRDLILAWRAEHVAGTGERPSRSTEVAVPEARTKAVERCLENGIMHDVLGKLDRFEQFVEAWNDRLAALETKVEALQSEPSRSENERDRLRGPRPFDPPGATGVSAVSPSAESPATGDARASCTGSTSAAQLVANIPSADHRDTHGAIDLAPTDQREPKQPGAATSSGWAPEDKKSSPPGSLEEQLRRAEVELSLERARLAREKAELEFQKAQMQRQREQLRALGQFDDAEEQPADANRPKPGLARRWLRLFGRKEQPRPEDSGK